MFENSQNQLSISSGTSGLPIQSPQKNVVEKMGNRTSCCRSFLAFVLKFLNFLQSFIGLSMIIYSVYMLNHWHNHRIPSPASAPSLESDFNIMGASDHFLPSNFAAGFFSGIDNVLKHNLPTTWFIYAFMGVGVLVCCITFIGHIAAEAFNGCCFCLYALLTTVLILLEAFLVAFIGLDHRWEKDLPLDPTGEIYNLCAFVEENIDICKWVGITVVIIQALSLLLAMILRAMVSSQITYDDIEEDYNVRGRTQEPLPNPQLRPTAVSIKGDSRATHSDIWSSRMREKYGLGGSDAKYNLLNQNPSVDAKPLQ